MASESGHISVTVCYARGHDVWSRTLSLPAGATLARALAESGFAQAFPAVDPLAHGVGVLGQLRGPETVLADGDRVEVYRALSFDPKESRRRRDAHRRAKAAAQGGRTRPAGLL
ncbi:RnfH family protein [Pseudomonadota bacterium AL_CKDN230030165-1A_HGKHYDSX7]